MQRPPLRVQDASAPVKNDNRRFAPRKGNDSILGVDGQPWDFYEIPVGGDFGPIADYLVRGGGTGGWHASAPPHAQSRLYLPVGIRRDAAT